MSVNLHQVYRETFSDNQLDIHCVDDGCPFSAQQHPPFLEVVQAVVLHCCVPWGWFHGEDQAKEGLHVRGMRVQIMTATVS